MNIRNILERLFQQPQTRTEPSILHKMRTDWDKRATENARHYVATSRDDWTDDEFFASGASCVRDYIESSLSDICNGRAPAELTVLEIGCGAGRMTLPMSTLFGQVHAVDISGEMIRRAQQLIGDRPNVQFHVNNGCDLSMFPNEVFDFAFSGIVFQHIPSRAVITNYIKETWRVLRPGSLFKFQLQGAPIAEQDADTWVGAGFTGQEMANIANQAQFMIKDMQGEGTQYFWLTFLKP